MFPWFSHQLLPTLSSNASKSGTTFGMDFLSGVAKSELDGFSSTATKWIWSHYSRNLSDRKLRSLSLMSPEGLDNLFCRNHTVNHSTKGLFYNGFNSSPRVPFYRDYLWSIISRLFISKKSLLSERGKFVIQALRWMLWIYPCFISKFQNFQTTIELLSV